MAKCCTECQSGPCASCQCCLYPAAKIGVSFGDADLPSEIKYDGIGGGATMGHVYIEGYGGTNAAGTYFYFLSVGGFTDSDGHTMNVWYLKIATDFDFVHVVSYTHEPCLVQDAPGGLLDEYPDTLHVGASVLHRVNPCEWTDSTGETSVRYGADCKWRVVTPAVIGTKSGTQDTPVGSYSGGIAVTAT